MYNYNLGYKIGIQGSLLKQFTDYVKRVLADSGLIRDQSVTRQFIQMAKSNGILDSIRFAWLGEAGYKQRTSGINMFWTKLYSLIGTNDATQTTSTNQPYLSGNIAPNEKWCLKNPNGGDEYMTHQTISFAANEAWSVQTVLNFNGDLAGASNPNNSLFGDISNNNTLFGLKHTSNSLIFRNSSGTVKQFTKGIDSFNGKTVVLHIVAIGNDTLSVYINGALYETVTTIPTNVIINKLFGYGPSYFGYFKISSHAIYSAALTPSQVAITSNFLRSLYPEIPSVTIGSQVWATSNCDMVATPMGNLIQNVTLNSNTEKITNIDDREFNSDTGFWFKDATWSISGGTANSTGANTDQWIRSSDLLLKVGKYYRCVFTISNYVSGAATIACGGERGEKRTANGTYTQILKCITVARAGVTGVTGNLLVASVDNISYEELNWSNATEIYDAVYADTTGTVEQKTYAAVKEAAMWCYYNNDPALGAVYGKLLNDYAIKLLDMDIAYYNTANPTTPWGWGIPTEADWNILETTINNDAEALKHAGTTYWTAPNAGTNSSGFTALPAGYRKEDGTFAGLNTTALFGSTDMSVPRIGKSLRLIKR